MPEEKVNPSPEQNQPDYTKNALHQKATGDWDKANNSYFNAVSELGKTHEALQTATQRAAQLEAMLSASLGGQPANQDPFAELSALGIDSRAFEDAVSRRVNAGIEAKLGEMLGPVVSRVQAEEQLADEIPNFDQHKADARAFMKSDPDVTAVFQELIKTNPVAAWKFAIRSATIAKQARPDVKAPVGPNTGRGQAERSAEPAPNADAEAKALEYLNTTGDARAYRSERFKGTSVEGQVRAIMEQMGIFNTEGYN